MSAYIGLSYSIAKNLGHIENHKVDELHEIFELCIIQTAKNDAFRYYLFSKKWKINTDLNKDWGLSSH